MEIKEIKKEGDDPGVEQVVDDIIDLEEYAKRGAPAAARKAIVSG